MSKTVIRIRTFMCPNCRFHRAVNNMPKDSLCPVHKVALIETSDPDDQVTVTVSGEDEVDDFVQVNGEFIRAAWLASKDAAETAAAAREGRPPRLLQRAKLTNEDRVALIKS